MTIFRDFHIILQTRSKSATWYSEEIFVADKVLVSCRHTYHYQFESLKFFNPIFIYYKMLSTSLRDRYIQIICKLWACKYEKHEIEVRNNYTEKFVEFPIS